MDPDGRGDYYRSIVGKMSLTTTQDVTGAAFADTRRRPGHAASSPATPRPACDGAPLYGSLESAAAGGFDQQTTLAHDREGPDRWPRRGSTRSTARRLPGPHRRRSRAGCAARRCSRATAPRPRSGRSTTAPGTFSPNGDGVAGRAGARRRAVRAGLWTLRIRDGDGDVKTHTSGDGDTASMTLGARRGHRRRRHATAGSSRRPTAGATARSRTTATVKVDTQAPALSLGRRRRRGRPVVRPQRRRLPRDGLVRGHARTSRASLVATVRRRRRRRRRQRSRPRSAAAPGRSPGTARRATAYAADGRTRSASARRTAPATVSAAADADRGRSTRALGFVDVVAHRVLPAGRRRHGEARRRSRCGSARRRRSTGRSSTSERRRRADDLAADRGDATPAAMRFAWDGRTTPARSSRAARTARGQRDRRHARRRAARGGRRRRVPDRLVSDTTPGRGQKVTVTIVTPGADAQEPADRALPAGHQPLVRRDDEAVVHHVPGHVPVQVEQERDGPASRPTAATSTARARPRACTCRSTEGGARRDTGPDSHTGPARTAPDRSRPHLTRAYRSQPGPSTHGPDAGARARVTVPGGAPARRVRTRRQGPVPRGQAVRGHHPLARMPCPDPRRPGRLLRSLATGAAGRRDGRRHPPRSRPRPRRPGPERPFDGAHRRRRARREDRRRSGPVDPPAAEAGTGQRPSEAYEAWVGTRTTRSRSRPATGSRSASSRVPTTAGRSAAPRRVALPPGRATGRAMAKQPNANGGPSDAPQGRAAAAPTTRPTRPGGDAAIARPTRPSTPRRTGSRCRPAAVLARRARGGARVRPRRGVGRPAPGVRLPPVLGGQRRRDPAELRRALDDRLLLGRRRTARARSRSATPTARRRPAGAAGRARR